MINIKYGYFSDIGLYRNINQDFFDFKKNIYNNYLFVVCDGMGGHKNSELASKIACKELIKYFKKVNFNILNDKQIFDWFYKIILIIKNKMINYLNFYPKAYDMGTTLISCLISNNKIYVINIGDSRLYKLYNNNIFQITKDHNYINSLNINEIQNLKFEGQFIKKYNINDLSKLLISSIGPNKKIKIDNYIINDIKGTYILTTDGIHNFLNKNDFLEVLSSDNYNCNDKVKILINKAIQNLSTDNLTGLLFEIF